ncbi:LysE family translocator [Halobaculum limi]|uniref:LysE family translocator n=1 Tax=Halobaculum limi TaxID=3031916 RepID=UPI0024051878|nr:LysE family transporter [Halobaculum sp. YSMS11]
MFGLDAPTLAAFVVAAGALVLVPGQDTLVVLTRGFASSRAGVGAALGVATGVLVHATAAALGLAALYRAVPTAATVVTLGGAAYLCWLAVDTVRSDAFDATDPDATTTDTARTDGGTGGAVEGYRRGLLTNVANPKVALFFLAFLPGFAGEGETMTMLLLGLVYALLAAVYLSVVGSLAGRIGAMVAGRAACVVRFGSAAVLLALAAALVLRAI